MASGTSYKYKPKPIYFTQAFLGLLFYPSNSCLPRFLSLILFFIFLMPVLFFLDLGFFIFSQIYDSFTFSQTHACFIFSQSHNMLALFFAPTHLLFLLRLIARFVLGKLKLVLFCANSNLFQFLKLMLFQFPLKPMLFFLKLKLVFFCADSQLVLFSQSQTNLIFSNSCFFSFLSSQCFFYFLKLKLVSFFLHLCFFDVLKLIPVLVSVWL